MALQTESPVIWSLSATTRRRPFTHSHASLASAAAARCMLGCLYLGLGILFEPPRLAPDLPQPGAPNYPNWPPPITSQTDRQTAPRLAPPQMSLRLAPKWCPGLALG